VHWRSLAAGWQGRGCLVDGFTWPFGRGPGETPTVGRDLPCRCRPCRGFCGRRAV
ncbi:unnamed protein product, partial [Effrenium voratum]